MDVTNEEQLKAETDKGLVLVDFWAPWCAPCKATLRVLDAEAPNHPDLKVVKVNVDEADPELIKAFEVRGIPTFILYRDGAQVTRKSGALNAAALQELVGTK